MKFIVLFEDSDTVDSDIRKKNMPAHLSFLESNALKIGAAGPLFNTKDEGAGGLWVVNADSVESVEQLIHEDPFWPTGLRKSYSVFAWRQVFADGDRLISG